MYKMVQVTKPVTKTVTKSWIHPVTSRLNSLLRMQRVSRTPRSHEATKMTEDIAVVRAAHAAGWKMTDLVEVR